MLFSKVSKKYVFPLDKAKDNDLIILPHRLPKVEAAQWQSLPSKSCFSVRKHAFNQKTAENSAVYDGLSE